MPAARATALLTLLAMIAFAANSVLNRLALASGDIGPVAFTLIRLVSGAAILLLITGPPRAWKASSWLSALALFAYALGFSLAYITLAAGTGALVLFGMVQVTMIGWALRSGERFTILRWIGLFLAICGLSVLLVPGASAPAISGLALMSAAGMAWGIYSLRGRGNRDPAASTSGNFARAVLLSLPVCSALLLLTPEATPATTGIALAVASGALTSGLGYVIWYAALRGLTAGTAGIVQLSVPVIAALGGVIFIQEALSLQLIFAGTLTLTGIALATLRLTRSSEAPKASQ